jgi:uncharacterized protein
MMTVILGIVRVLVILLIIRLVVSAIRNFTGRGAPAKGRTRVAERAGGVLVRDPHCGTYLPESRALTVGKGSDVMHFCSPACRDAWTSAHGRAGAKA